MVLNRIFFAYLILLFLWSLSSRAQDYDVYLELGYDLLYYADIGDLEYVKKHVEDYKIDVDFENYDYITALMLASQAGYDDIVEYLISKGADVNKQAKYNGISPLISAVRNDYLRTAEILIRSGADINTTDALGRQAIHYAAMNGYIATTDMLIYYFSQLEELDNFGFSPIMYAVANNQDSVTDLLINNLVNIYTLDNRDNSLLHIAAQHNNIYFINKYAHLFANDLNKNKEGLYPTESAVASGHHKAVQLLLEKDFVLRDTINEVFTPRTLAKYSGKYRTKRIIRRLGYKDNHFTYFRKIGLGYEFLFNSTEFFLGFNVSLSEDRYGFLTSFGFITRGAPKQVLVPIYDNEFYLLKEKRYGMYLLLQKHFKLFNLTELSYVSLYAQIRPIYTWGTHIGIENNFRPELIACPGFGISFNFITFLQTSFNYEYMNMGIYSVKPHIYNINMRYMIPFRKSETDEKNKYIIKY